MISPLVLKVKPRHSPDFAAHRDCSVVESVGRFRGNVLKQARAVLLCV
jgi:hypothetical protein